jgi:hypothetical protein
VFSTPKGMLHPRKFKQVVAETMMRSKLGYREAAQ